MNEKLKLPSKYTHVAIHLDETQGCLIDINSVATNASSPKFARTLNLKVGPTYDTPGAKTRQTAKIAGIKITLSADDMSTDLPGVPERGEVRTAASSLGRGTICPNLTAVRSAGEYEVPLTEASKKPELFAAHGLTKRDWERLEASQGRVPRFLFRCFGPKSGGNPDLNTINGIIPRGFLDGDKPTDMYMTDRLGEMIIDHIEVLETRTIFSSWSSCITNAIENASDKSYVAIIDRELLAPHVKVYRVLDLCEAGLCGSSGVENYAEDYDLEYLAYGPINGPGFHCVKYEDFRIRHEDLYYRRIYDEDPCRTVAKARQLAGLFRPAHDERPDIVIALTVLFLCLHFDGVKDERVRILEDGLLDAVVLCLRRELQSISLPPVNCGPFPLICPEMYTGPHRHLQQTVHLWRCIEGKVRSGEIPI
ncbi:hypothetical protein F4814DRAFT_455858 [Daldinia grandis]|nr:hypothetical protein F4814DRAFT_455858 [Daldinia grandis]